MDRTYTGSLFFKNTLASRVAHEARRIDKFPVLWSFEGTAYKAALYELIAASPYYFKTLAASTSMLDDDKREYAAFCWLARFGVGIDNVGRSFSDVHKRVASVGMDDETFQFFRSLG